jgi:hypothetical protein
MLAVVGLEAGVCCFMAQNAQRAVSFKSSYGLE